MSTLAMIKNIKSTIIKTNDASILNKTRKGALKCKRHKKEQSNKKTVTAIVSKLMVKDVSG